MSRSAPLRPCYRHTARNRRSSSRRSNRRTTSSTTTHPGSLRKSGLIESFVTKVRGVPERILHLLAASDTSATRAPPGVSVVGSDARRDSGGRQRADRPAPLGARPRRATSQRRCCRTSLASALTERRNCRPECRAMATSYVIPGAAQVPGTARAGLIVNGCMLLPRDTYLPTGELT